MLELKKIQEYQFQFTKHIRNPKAQPRPKGVAPRRMAVYNELLYNNLESFLLACFPVTKKLLSQQKWARLVRDFFSEHRAQTPYFRQIPEEFVRYLQDRRGEDKAYPRFLKYLAHYEWAELAVDVSSKESDFSLINKQGDLLEARPALNPALMLLYYPYAVHRISPDYQPKKEEPTFLLVFRNLEDEVNFMELNPVSARLVELLQSAKLTGMQALKQIVVELKHPNPDVVIKGGKQVLKDLKKQQAILGVWKAES